MTAETITTPAVNLGQLAAEVVDLKVVDFVFRELDQARDLNRRGWKVNYPRTVSVLDAPGDVVVIHDHAYLDEDCTTSIRVRWLGRRGVARALLLDGQTIRDPRTGAELCAIVRTGAREVRAVNPAGKTLVKADTLYGCVARATRRYLRPARMAERPAPDSTNEE